MIQPRKPGRQPPPPPPAYIHDLVGACHRSSRTDAHRMAGKSPVSSFAGVLALLALGAFMLYGVQTLSKGVNSPRPARAVSGSVATLYTAAAGGDIKALTAALSGLSPVDLNAPCPTADGGRQGLTALMIACMDGNDAAVRLLLDAKARTDARTEDGRTALMFAAGWGDASRVQALIDAGARVDARTNDGRTALMWAAHRGDPGSVRALLAAGAGVNETNKWRQTPLMGAAGSGSIEKLTALLDAGADVRAADHRGETALHIAASTDAPPELLDLLIRRGAVVDAADLDGVTPLMKAAERADAEQVKCLLNAGASPLACDKINKWTARDWASKRDDERGRAVADLLLPDGAK
ncbi:MAG: ankyrin repeat domain-containing protein [Phycisphaerales bacterium]